VRQTRFAAQEKGRKLAMQLKPGDWLCAQVRWRPRSTRNRGSVEASDNAEERWSKEPYWIGRAADAGNGSCIVKKFEARDVGGASGGTVFEGTTFGAGDIAVAVEWYDRHPADSEGLHFQKWDHEAAGNDVDARFVISATEIRHGKFNMSKARVVEPALNTARYTRHGPHRSCSRAVDQVWELGRDIHARIMASLW